MRFASREALFEELRHTLVDLFELDANRVTPGARLYDDLELDSIDAIDMVARLQEMTGLRVPEDAMRRVHTVDDVVAVIERLQQGGP